MRDAILPAHHVAWIRTAGRVVWAGSIHAERLDAFSTSHILPDSSSGLGRLPVWVARILSVLRFIAFPLGNDLDELLCQAKQRTRVFLWIK